MTKNIEYLMNKIIKYMLTPMPNRYFKQEVYFMIIYSKF